MNTVQQIPSRNAALHPKVLSLPLTSLADPTRRLHLRSHRCSWPATRQPITAPRPCTRPRARRLHVTCRSKPPSPPGCAYHHLCEPHATRRHHSPAFDWHLPPAPDKCHAIPESRPTNPLPVPLPLPLSNSNTERQSKRPLRVSLNRPTTTRTTSPAHVPPPPLLLLPPAHWLLPSLKPPPYHLHFPSLVSVTAQSGYA